MPSYERKKQEEWAKPTLFVDLKEFVRNWKLRIFYE